MDEKGEEKKKRGGKEGGELTSKLELLLPWHRGR